MRPVVSIVATYRDIPYANSDWYLERVIRPRADLEGRPLPSDTFGLPSRPVVMGLEVLEMFIVCVNVLGITPLDLFREKEEHNQMSMGVWVNFLRRKLNPVKSAVKLFDFVIDANRSFHASLIPLPAK